MKKYLALTAVCMFFNYSFSQLPFFLTPPNVYITESGYSGNCIQSLSGTPTSTHQVANGYWDEDWVSRFYVVNDSIFNRTGGFLAKLNGYQTAIIGGEYSQYFPWNGEGMNDDIVIIPKPGVCKHLYVIYSVPGTVYSSAVIYTEVDISSNTPSVVYLSDSATISPNSLINLGTVPTTYLAGTEGSQAVCLAASKPYDSNNDRILYVAGADGNIYSVPVTSSGFGTANNIGTVVNYGTEGAGTYGWIGQMKLRSDGQLLGWAETAPLTGGTLYELQVDTSTGENISSPANWPLPTGVTRVNGIEFLDGTDGDLILSTNNGLYAFYDSSGTYTFKQMVSGDYEKSQINYDISGYFYLVNDAGILKKVSNTFTGGVPTFTISDANNAGYPTCTIYSDVWLSSGAQQFSSIYTLPNEVDGGNYTYFTGVSPTTCSYEVNGVAPTSTCADIQQVYNCTPITLTNLSSGAESYTLSLNSINGSCDVVSGGSYLSYTESDIASLPTDLRSVDGNYLETHTGSYELTITANNACGDNSTVSTFINVNASPGSTTTSIGINNPNTGIACYGGTISSPCALCSGSPTMNISNSTGTITYYSKTVYQYVSGSWVKVYYSGEISTPGGISSLTGIYVGYNGTDVSNSPLTAWADGAYYVVDTMGNACGTSAGTCYMEYQSCHEEHGPTGINNVDAISEFNTYPNPFNDKIDFEITVANGTQIGIKLFDVTGRLVNEQAPQYYSAGQHTTSLETSGLSTGVYLYELIADDKTYTGKLVKTE